MLLIANALDVHVVGRRPRVLSLCSCHEECEGVLWAVDGPQTLSAGVMCCNRSRIALYHNRVGRSLSSMSLPARQRSLRLFRLRVARVYQGFQGGISMVVQVTTASGACQPLLLSRSTLQDDICVLRSNERPVSLGKKNVTLLYTKNDVVEESLATPGVRLLFDDSEVDFARPGGIKNTPACSENNDKVSQHALNGKDQHKHDIQVLKRLKGPSHRGVRVTSLINPPSLSHWC